MYLLEIGSELCMGCSGRRSSGFDAFLGANGVEKVQITHYEAEWRGEGPRKRRRRSAGCDGLYLMSTDNFEILNIQY